MQTINGRCLLLKIIFSKNYEEESKESCKEGEEGKEKREEIIPRKHPIASIRNGVFLYWKNSQSALYYMYN
jgi:hypothetical protein